MSMRYFGDRNVSRCTSHDNNYKSSSNSSRYINSSTVPDILNPANYPNISKYYNDVTNTSLNKLFDFDIYISNNNISLTFYNYSTVN